MYQNRQFSRPGWERCSLHLFVEVGRELQRLTAFAADPLLGAGPRTSVLLWVQVMGASRLLIRFPSDRSPLEGRLR
jgi:hypothetical protein